MKSPPLIPFFKKDTKGWSEEFQHFSMDRSVIYWSGYKVVSAYSGCPNIQSRPIENTCTFITLTMIYRNIFVTMSTTLFSKTVTSAGYVFIKYSV